MIRIAGQVLGRWMKWLMRALSLFLVFINCFSLFYDYLIARMMTFSN